MAVKGCIGQAPTVVLVEPLRSPSSRLPAPSVKLVVADDIRRLFETAQRVRAALRDEPSYHPLRGRHLALLMACEPDARSALLQAAAVQLGARVALVRYAHAEHTTARDLETLAKHLGRMYDAIDCLSLPRPALRQIGLHAGVPVTDGLGSAHHQLCALADLMTLLEQAVSSHSHVTACLDGNRRTRRARYFVAAARSMGVDILSSNDVQPEACNEVAFLIDARHPDWPLHATTQTLDEARRADNHFRLIQAVLLVQMTMLRD